VPRTPADPALRYDAAYFERWYRSRAHRVRTPTEIARIVAMTVAATEYVLERPLRTVLDVGAGEGHWRGHLRRLRPRVRYVGVEPSEYAVRRFGRSRDLRQGTLATLPSLGLDREAPQGFDLIVSCGVLNYVPEPELAAGLATLAALSNGVAFLELFTAGDAITGDIPRDRRPASWYAGLLASTGWTPCGLHCYVPAHVAERMVALELP
jgi:SAM-dependent methyltransferase